MPLRMPRGGRASIAAAEAAWRQCICAVAKGELALPWYSTVVVEVVGEASDEAVVEKVVEALEVNLWW